MTTVTVEQHQRLIATLELALRYLEHPDVLAVTRLMALSGDVVVARCKRALAPLMLPDEGR